MHDIDELQKSILYDDYMVADHIDIEAVKKGNMAPKRENAEDEKVRD